MSGADEDIFAQLRGFAQRGQNAQRAIDRQGAGVPGKRTLIEQQLGAQVHGAMRERCDEPSGGAACFLDVVDRGRLEGQITAHALGAAQKWGQALTDARLVRLCEHDAGWGALWQIAFDLAMPALAAGATDGTLNLLSEAARSAWSAQALAPIVNSESVRDELRGLFTDAAKAMMPPEVAASGASGEHKREAAFLASLADAPVDWAMGIITRARHLDDLGLIALADATDPATVLTVAHFTRAIAELLARWSTQVDAIGQRGARDGEYESCAWITPRDGGAERLARVVRATPDGRQPLTATAFRGWIDDDMRPMALAQWAHAFPGQGIEIVTLDRLTDVPAAARAWERGVAVDLPDEDIEPHRETSHEARP